MSDTERTVRIDNHRGHTSHEPWASLHIASRAATAGRALAEKHRQAQANPDVMPSPIRRPTRSGRGIWVASIAG